jgi:hypothetical protein
MRHEYMEQLMYRASQQQELISRVQQNNAMHKLERNESKARRQTYEVARLAKIDDEKKIAKEIRKHFFRLVVRRLLHHYGLQSIFGTCDLYYDLISVSCLYLP